MKWMVWGVVLLGCIAGRISPAAEERSPIGPVLLEMADKSSVSGLLLDINDETLVVRTRDGDKTYERKKIRKLDTISGKEAAAIINIVESKPKPAAPAKAPAPAVAAQPVQPSQPAPAPQPAAAQAATKLAASAPSKEETPNALTIGKAAKPDVLIVDDVDDDVPTPKKIKARVNENQDKQLLARLRGPRNEDGVFEPRPNERPPSREVVHMPADETKHFERALASIEQHDYRSASISFRSLIAKSTDAEVAAADAACRQKFNRPLTEIMVSCYMQLSCGVCRGEGIVRCPDCNGTGYIQKNIGAPDGNANAGPGRQAVPGRARVAICNRCRGNAYDVCGACSGTRMSFAEPTPYEREAYSQYCIRQATEALCTSEVNYGDTAREGLQSVMPGGDAKLRGVVEQAWLRDTTNRVKSDICRLWRAEGFYRMALKADPTLPLRYTSKDLNQELTKIGLRRQHLYAELAERSRFQDFHLDE